MITGRDLGSNVFFDILDIDHIPTSEVFFQEIRIDISLDQTELSFFPCKVTFFREIHFLILIIKN